MITFKSEDWKHVVSVLEKSLKNARDMIEQKSTSPEDTAFYRGRIALAKEILSIPETMEFVSREQGNK